jgi:hypothetical protein
VIGFVFIFLFSKSLGFLYAYDFSELLKNSSPSQEKAKEFQSLLGGAQTGFKNESKLEEEAQKTLPEYKESKEKQQNLAAELRTESDDSLKAKGEAEYESNSEISSLRALLEKEPDEIHSFHGLFESLKTAKSLVACKESDSQAPSLDDKFPIKKEKISETKKEMEYSRVTCQSRSSKVIACKNTLTQLTCKNRGNCSAGGIVRGSETARLQALNLNYPHMEVGTTSKIYDEGRCKIINEDVRFQIKNINLIGEFRLLHMSYSDWIRLELNGVEIVNTTGGQGSFTMEASRMGWFSIPQGDEYCSLRSGDKKQACNTKEFYKKDPNLDLKPFLKEGNNHLKIELAFGNSGQLYLKFFAPERCCTDFDEHWRETCVEK